MGGLPVVENATYSAYSGVCRTVRTCNEIFDDCKQKKQMCAWQFDRTKCERYGSVGCKWFGGEPKPTSCPQEEPGSGEGAPPACDGRWDSVDTELDRCTGEYASRARARNWDGSIWRNLPGPECEYN